jgi:two-component system, NtrC family, sensor kinase
MNTLAAEGTAYHLGVRRIFWLPIVVSGVLVVLVLAALVAISWHSFARIQPVEVHSAHIRRLQDIEVRMEDVLLRGLRGTGRLNREDMLPLGAEIDGLLATDRPDMSAGETARLEQIAGLLRGQAGGGRPIDDLSKALDELRSVQDRERREHRILLSSVAKDTETELELSLILVVVLPVAGVVALLLLRRRIKGPLNNLGELLVRLAARDYRPVPQAAVDESAALVQPVFHSYNGLVERLRRLEEEHRNREQTLEQAVRGATEALLKQSRQLARSDRLAAVGAVSAGLAHELRNPLAGIQMACTKLRRAISDADQLARLDAVVAELRRLNTMLTERVDAARHAPEPLGPVHLKSTVDQLLSLVRYQVPEGVRLESDIPSDLTCRLPEGGLRQALLNLVLNASQSMENGQGSVEIRARRRGDAVLLTVSDTGPGFPAEMLTMGVRPFASGRVGGAGLGLAMVRGFTQDINGELQLANREPCGAQVSLRVPCPSLPAKNRVEGP